MARQEQPDPLEQPFLYAHPNPQRIGCPGKQILKALARKELPINHPAGQHLGECSPCFREFLEYKSEWEKKRSRLYMIAALAASIILAFGIGVWWRTHPNIKTAAAMINFATTSQNRGADNEPPGPQESLQSYPREELTMTVNLPRGSIDGKYEFQIARPEAPDTELLVDVLGEAKVSNGLTTFTARVNLSGVPAGLYVARVRNLPAGGWHSLPVQIR